MKKTALALTAAAALFSFAAPASAAPLPAAGVSVDHTDASAQRRKVCTVRTVVHRDRFGRRIVRKVRTCR